MKTAVSFKAPQSGQSPALGGNFTRATFTEITQKKPLLTLQNQFVLQTGHKSGQNTGQIPTDTNTIYLILFTIDNHKNGKESGQND